MRRREGYRAGGWPPGMPETFPNLFNLGTWRVSESYLREYEIKQSDKQTPFLQSPSPASLPPLPPPSSRERSRSWPGWREVAPRIPAALMCALDTGVSRAKCL